VTKTKLVFKTEKGKKIKKSSKAASNFKQNVEYFVRHSIYSEDNIKAAIKETSKELAKALMDVKKMQESGQLSISDVDKALLSIVNDTCVSPKVNKKDIEDLVVIYMLD